MIETLFKGKQKLIKGIVYDAQKEAIKKRLKKIENDKLYTIEYCLQYPDHYLAFFAHDINQDFYTSLTSVLNLISTKNVSVDGESIKLIKCHTGQGSYARYVFSNNVLKQIIDDIEKETK